jgi:hypothetical protein
VVEIEQAIRYLLLNTEGVEQSMVISELVAE